MPTDAQINANRANAQHSTGPRTPEGKAASSRNALKFGLYAQADILPGESQEEFDELIREYVERYHPDGLAEIRLVHDLVRAIWLEHRYVRIETEVIKIRYAALPAEARELALGAIFIQDADGANLFQKIERRRAAAQRQVQRALRDIDHAIKTFRRLLEERGLPFPPPRPNPAPAPPPPDPVDDTPAPSVRSDNSASPAPAPPPAAAEPEKDAASIAHQEDQRPDILAGSPVPVPNQDGVDHQPGLALPKQ
ncbi:MAG TPA: hypothetical protein VMS37_00015 [Verrucomicrobiae bacterium]|nr:hypothetical protein [Verrucomicrobiae bacterium]